MTDPAATPLDLARAAIVGQILAFARGRAGEGHEGLAARVERELDLAGEAAVRSLVERLFVGDVPFGYQPPEVIPRRVHHLLAELMLEPGSGLSGEGTPGTPPTGPVVIASNHLSYADANLLAILFERIGWGALVDRLTVIAGPKVYSELVRHFMSLCFGTVKTPQSSALATEDAAMSAREVARVARETIQVAQDRLASGDALLVFVEGTRSRTGGMARALPAVGRYLEPPASQVMPVAIWGSEALFPLGDDRLHPARVRFAVGRAVDAAALSAATHGNRRLAMDVLGHAIAALLPAAYRGEYAASEPASELAARLFGADTGAVAGAPRAEPPRGSPVG